MNPNYQFLLDAVEQAEPADVMLAVSFILLGYYLTQAAVILVLRFVRDE